MKSRHALKALLLSLISVLAATVVTGQEKFNKHILPTLELFSRPGLFFIAGYNLSLSKKKVKTYGSLLKFPVARICYRFN